MLHYFAKMFFSKEMCYVLFLLFLVVLVLYLLCVAFVFLATPPLPTNMGNYSLASKDPKR